MREQVGRGRYRQFPSDLSAATGSVFAIRAEPWAVAIPGAIGPAGRSGHGRAKASKTCRHAQLNDLTDIIVSEAGEQTDQQPSGIGS